jgi:hypothetical protein
MLAFLGSLPWSGFYLILLSLVLIGIFLLQSSFYDKINKNGIEVEGMLFSVDREMTNSILYNFNTTYYDEVTFRFLTKEKIWVTKISNTSWITSFTGQYKEGDKVKVKYDPKEPNDFIVCQDGLALFLQYSILFGGFFLFALGVYKIIQS